MLITITRESGDRSVFQAIEVSHEFVIEPDLALDSAGKCRLYIPRQSGSISCRLLPNQERLYLLQHIFYNNEPVTVETSKMKPRKAFIQEIPTETRPSQFRTFDISINLLDEA